MTCNWFDRITDHLVNELITIYTNLQRSLPSCAQAENEVITAAKET